MYLRSNWSALHSGLTKMVSSKDSCYLYREERNRRPSFIPFKSPASLITYLTSTIEEREFKNHIYTNLVEISQNEQTRDLGLALLCLGLWPRLNKFYRHNRSDYPGDATPLVSEIWDCFTLAVSRARLDRINKVAATLTMNTERTYYYRRRKQRMIAAKELPLRKSDEYNAIDDVLNTTDISKLGLEPGLSPEEEAKRLMDLMSPIIGSNAELVIGYVVCGESIKQLSKLYEIPYGAALKRYERSIRKLREKLQPEIEEHQSARITK